MSRHGLTLCPCRLCRRRRSKGICTFVEEMILQTQLLLFQYTCFYTLVPQANIPTHMLSVEKDGQRKYHVGTSALSFPREKAEVVNPLKDGMGRFSKFSRCLLRNQKVV